ncbi:MAG TPA: carboxypeptidase-like regulatory domain-containing protein, partial [Bacteroidia bacterium]|nr:carboxypeptidase-like regulatory domain-containing protein [Bacteroidia bacterium]
MQKIIACFLLLFLGFATKAQTLKGRIIDANTNQTLPFVGVLIKNTQVGTLTDIDGKFQLDVSTAPNAELQIT